MPRLISDDGVTAEFLTEDGRTIRVASQHAQPYIEEPQPEPELALGAAQAPPDPALQAPDLQAAAAGTPQLPQVLDQDDDVVTFRGQLGEPVRVARAYADPYLPRSEPAADPGPVPDIPLPSGPAAALPDEGTMEPLDLTGPGSDQPAPPPGAPGEQSLPSSVAAPSILPERIPHGPLDTAALAVNAMQDESDARVQAAEHQGQGQDQIASSYAAGQKELDALALRRKEYEERRAKEYDRIHAGITRDVEKEANWRVDQGRYWHDRSTGSKVGMWMSAALAGLGKVISGRDPDKNPALDILLGFAEQDVRMQLAERDRRGQALEMRRQAAGDYSQHTQDRLAEFNAMTAGRVAKIARDIERYGAMSGAYAVRDNAKVYSAQLKAEAAKYVGAAAQQQADMIARAAEREQARRAAAAAARQRMIDQARAAAENRRRWMLENNATGIDPSTGLYVKGPLGEKDQLELDKLRADTSKATAEAGLAASKAGAGPRGIPGAVGDPSNNGEPIKNDDGSVWLPPTEKEQQEMRAVVPATANVRRIADLLKLAKDKYGGSSALAGSDEYQEVQSLVSTLDMEQKDIWGLGVIQGKDLEILQNVRGGKDPGSFIYDATKGLESMATRLEERTNSRMHGMGFRGKWRPARVDKAESIELTTEQNVGRIGEKVPTGAKGETPEAKALKEKVVSRKEAAFAAELRKKPPVEKLAEWANEVEKARAAGDLTAEEAIQIVNQGSQEALRQWQERIQKMDVDDLKRLQKDDAFYRRANILNLIQSGKARPDEVYRLVRGL